MNERKKNGNKEVDGLKCLIRDNRREMRKRIKIEC